MFSPDFHEILEGRGGGGGGLNFKFGPFIGRFPSDGAASIAVKGLNGFDRYSPSDNMTSQSYEIKGPSFVGLAGASCLYSKPETSSGSDYSSVQ